MSLDPKYKAVGFDMDGTFMNTDVDYTKLANLIFDEMVKMGVPESSISRNEGSKFRLDSGVKWLIENGRGKEMHEIQGRIADKSTVIEMENADRSVPFDGAVDVLKLLKQKGYKVGIVTRGGRRYAEYVLGLHDLLKCFDEIVARDDFPEEQAKPSPCAIINLADALGVKSEEVLFLGDHKYDWMTAKDSGAGFYGVLSGGYTKEDWKDIDENISILNTVKDLLDII